MSRGAGGVDRIESAVRDTSPDLLAYFARRVDSPEDAADLLAATLLAVWKRVDALPSDAGEVRPWMFGIARNALLHYYRGKRRRASLADRLRGVLAAEPRPGFADASEFDALHDALRTLDEVDREIMALVHWEGLSLVEAARILKLKDSTVRSRYHRARAALRKQLESSISAPTSLSAAP